MSAAGARARAEQALETYGLVEAQVAELKKRIELVSLCTERFPGLTARNQRIHLLVSLLLSSQTKDQVTANAMHKLRTQGCAQGFNLAGLRELSESRLEELIYPVAFYKKKAAYLVQVFSLLETRYNGDIPRELDDIVALPGIGPKMAYLLLAVAWDDVRGIGVDTHVHRLAQMWHWVDPSGSPEKTRKQLQALLPQSLWLDVNDVLVRFGQYVCVPRAPKCRECAVESRCPGSRLKKVKGEEDGPKIKLEVESPKRPVVRRRRR